MEWDGLGRSPSGRVFRIVEPESNVKSLGERQSHNWIEAENLLQEDGPDRHIGVAFAVALEIGLVPGEAEVLEVGIGRAIPTADCCSVR